MSISIAREVRPDELVEVLGPVAARQITEDLVKGVVEVYGESPGRRRIEDVYFEADGQSLDVYLRDDLENAIGHGGVLVCEYLLPWGTFDRCLVCGEENEHAPRAWCSKRCRMLLRDLAREQHPGLSDEQAIEETGRWAAAQRHSLIGWFIPLTQQIAEALYGG